MSYLNNMDPISITVAALSLVISVFTLWKTYLDKGALRMTQPTTIFFGPDGKDTSSSKVFLRTLLFSTSEKGQVIESMHVRLSRGESVQTFNIWIYGEKNQLVRGSGLYVGKEGVTYNHHFLLPKDGMTYEFVKGKYRLEVYASILNKKVPHKMFTVTLEVDDNQAAKLKEGRAGLYYDWGPESGNYYPHLHQAELTPYDIAELLRLQ
jgi:hypothetical protein